MRNWADIGRRHYVRKATADNHWVDFFATKVRKFHAAFGDDFCLVINGSETADDAYVIPYVAARTVFDETYVDRKGRWCGRILGSNLIVTPGNKSLNVAPYHNAFALLDSATGPLPTEEEAGVTVDSVADDALETTLHLESDLESFLISDLSQLEKGLRLFDGEGVSGRQFDAGAAGRIDILATDARNGFVVVEVKAGEADRQVCGQIQAYMGWVAESLARGRNVRGIIVASGFTERLKFAAKANPARSLKAYSVVFRFRDS